MTTLNVKNLATLNGTSTGKVLTTSAQDIITAPADSVDKVNHLMVTNITGTTANVTIGFYDSATTTTYYMLATTPVPAYGAIDVLSSKPFYLKENDKITALASANTTLHITASWELLS